MIRHITIFLVFIQTACLSSTDPRLSSVVADRTVIPESFSKGNSSPNDGPLEIPIQMFDVFNIEKQKVVMRIGPGTKFPLRDEIVLKNTLVLLLDTHGIWRKVVVVNTNKVGWVHHHTIKKIRPVGSIVLNSSALPKVFAIRRISKGWKYQSKKPINVEIPKGYSFRYLRKNNEKVLVHLKGTNSIIWLDRKAVQ